MADQAATKYIQLQDLVDCSNIALRGGVLKPLVQRVDLLIRRRQLLAPYGTAAITRIDRWVSEGWMNKPGSIYGQDVRQGLAGIGNTSHPYIDPKYQQLMFGALYVLHLIADGKYNEKYPGVDPDVILKLYEISIGSLTTPKTNKHKIVDPDPRITNIDNELLVKHVTIRDTDSLFSEMACFLLWYFLFDACSGVVVFSDGRLMSWSQFQEFYFFVIGWFRTRRFEFGPLYASDKSQEIFMVLIAMLRRERTVTSTGASVKLSEPNSSEVISRDLHNADYYVRIEDTSEAIRTLAQCHGGSAFTKVQWVTFALDRCEAIKNDTDGFWQGPDLAQRLLARKQR